MTIWGILGIVCAAGALGGLVNALLTENGFALPKRDKVGSLNILRPGVLGNMLISSVAAGTSWGLYGPLAGFVLLGSTNAKQPELTITLSALVGAVLVGVAGAKWLTNEVDKNLLKAAAAKAATSSPDAGKAQAMALASPVQAAALANSLHVVATH
jgi:uncharacterized membrane protein